MHTKCTSPSPVKRRETKIYINGQRCEMWSETEVEAKQQQQQRMEKTFASIKMKRKEKKTKKNCVSF